jgi:hypothetical protein
MRPDGASPSTHPDIHIALDRRSVLTRELAARGNPWPDCIIAIAFMRGEIK